MSEEKEHGAELLRRGAAELGIALSEQQTDQFLLYRALLLEWSDRFNLTAIKEPSAILSRHFLDSLTASLGCLGMQQALRLRTIDIGAGAGCPGLALNIAFPEWRVTELEATGKKARFMEEVIRRVGLAHARVITGRAEEIAHLPHEREQYDLCLARALARTRTLAEYTLPFCRVGGHVICLKKGDTRDEQEEARGAIERLGGRLASVIPVPELADLGADRHLIVLEKVRRTPILYPRPASALLSHPL